ncbi:MAG: ATP-dependent DNA helicase, partial [Terriglobia bacterium]
MPAAKENTAQETPLSKIFGPDGWLARHHPRYEFRTAQLEMAEEVESALKNSRHLIAEAGTGTGKTLAYLVPVILSGRRVVISTGTKNLQEQLFFKDIPFLKKLFPKISAALMKGRQNYLCRQKLYDLGQQPVLTGIDEVGLIQQVQRWELKTETGDRAELRDMPDTSELWSRIDARREACTGQKCEQFKRCFITLMHQRAQESDLIIVNHHLFFADLALRQTEAMPLLPDYHAVIFDEAHEIEDVATRYFGLQVSNYRFEELARDTEATAKQRNLAVAELLPAWSELRRRAELFFDLFPRDEGRRAFENRSGFLEVNRGAYSALSNALVRLESELLRVTERPEEITQLARRAAELRQDCEVVLESKDRNLVFWWERRGRGLFLEASPIDVSSILREKLFDRTDCVILTSATLAVRESFDFLKSRLG